MVHATGHTALVIAVWVQTGGGRSKERGMKGGKERYSKKYNRLTKPFGSVPIHTLENGSHHFLVHSNVKIDGFVH